MEDMQERLKGNSDLALSEDSLEHAFVKEESSWDSTGDLSDSFVETGHRLGLDKPPSFYLLPPIEENSEPSTSSESSDKRCHSMQNLLSERPLESPRSQTFPRSKATELKQSQKLCYEGQTLYYPLEPRELDPESFHQLHTADSCEELQEFLLLESQCMNADTGIAAAFLTSGTNPLEPNCIVLLPVPNVPLSLYYYYFSFYKAQSKFHF